MSPLGDCRAGKVGGVNLFAQMLVIFIYESPRKKTFRDLNSKNIFVYREQRTVKITQIKNGKEAAPRLHT